MYYIVAGIIDIACAVFILFDPMATPAILLIKLMSIPVLAISISVSAGTSTATFP